MQQLDGVLAARKMRIDHADPAGSPAAAARRNQRAHQSPGDNMTSCWVPPSGNSRYSAVGGQQSSTLLSTYPDNTIQSERSQNNSLYASRHPNEHHTGNTNYSKHQTGALNTEQVHFIARNYSSLP